ncbi:MAG: glycosyltransferase [Ktedonobacteraceae bacterium]|nr:glycosyltransferase [Ktedonobacteraceae bacterium]
MFSHEVSVVPERKLFVSIVVPVYNQVDFIAACLASLFDQTYPLESYEIILVDDGSSDGTTERALEVVQGWHGAFRRVRNVHAGPACARNAGIRAARAEIIAFIDSDCVADADWLERLVEALLTSDSAGVGGPLINVARSGWISRYLDATAFFRHRVRHGQVDYLLTANVAFRRSALLSINGFSEQDGAWCEDADLSFRLLQAGYTLRLAAQGSVTHYGAPASLRGLIRNLYRYGYGNTVLSRNWHNGRTPAMELLRHAGAFALSPALAISYSGKVGPVWAIAFWPLIMLEHGAFVAGLIAGNASQRKQFRLTAPRHSAEPPSTGLIGESSQARGSSCQRHPGAAWAGDRPTIRRTD